MKAFKKVIAITLIMVMMCTNYVMAAEHSNNDNNNNIDTREVNWVTANNRQFSGSCYRYIDGYGPATIYLDVVMNLGYYYEEGVYAEIANFVYVSSSAKIGITPVTCNFYQPQTYVHDGLVCSLFGINGYMYRAHLLLDEWGDEYIGQFNITTNFDCSIR